MMRAYLESWLAVWRDLTLNEKLVTVFLTGLFIGAVVL